MNDRDNEHAVTCLVEQGFPRGLIHALVHRSKEAFPQRVWIVDNSGSMSTFDGRKLVSTKNKNQIQWKSCTRWEELKECVTYHAEMAALLLAPTKFIWLNQPDRNRPQSYDIANLGQAYLEDELESLFHTLRDTYPSGVTPLARHLHDLYKMLLPLKESLLREGQQVVVCLATDGIPTDETGVMAAIGTAARADFERAIRRLLHDLPVWMVIRLCTDDDAVMQYYEELDGQLEFNLEVLDDYLGEAKEINKYNPWLTYGLPLHRCREMGFHDKLLDMLDERKLTLDEVSQFARLLLVGESSSPSVPTTAKSMSSMLTDAHADWDGFVRDLNEMLSANDLTYHPIRKRLRPWIDIAILERSYGPKSHNQSFRWFVATMMSTIAVILLAILLQRYSLN